DFDNDRDVDIFHATGQFTFPLIVRRKGVRNIKEKYSFYEYPVFYERSEIGTTPFFRWDASKIGFEATDGRGAAGIDYDNDGYREIALAVSGGEYRLYDVAMAGNNALQIDLQSGPNGTALGARVAVTAGGETQYRYHNARTDYLSQDSRVIHVGLGNFTRADVTVTWPDGTTQTFRNVAAGQRLVITRAGIVDRIQLSESSIPTRATESSPARRVLTPLPPSRRTGST
ncbi:MAG: ASPIC/UnbV domain-containing protein, partial [Haloarculaceae archaeon]